MCSGDQRVKQGTKVLVEILCCLQENGPDLLQLRTQGIFS